MNLGTMKTALRRYAGVDATDPLVDWINAGLHEFQEAYPWPFLQSNVGANLAAGAFTIGPPGDFFRTEDVRLLPTGADPIPLTYKPWGVVIEEGWRIRDATVKGVPQWFSIYWEAGAPSLLVYPAADLTYSYIMNYEVNVPDLVNDADVPGVPSRYHYTIVEGAAVRALQAESEEDRAQTARQIFEDSIDRHITAIGGRRQSGQFNQVRDVMGYGS